MKTKFDCDRTCPFYERRDWCRFNPLISAIGNKAMVTSHTATVSADYATNKEALKKAVLAMGGQWLGAGIHKLYENDEVGIGFRLPKWRFPLCLRQDGTLAYDDYNGRWGTTSDLGLLESHYTRAGIQARADELGWTCQDDGDSLLIFHPSGGTLAVNKSGQLETDGFIGSGCHDAAAQLTSAVGEVTDVMNTPAYYTNNQQIQLPTE